jgi:hypothetical protein
VLSLALFGVVAPASAQSTLDISLQNDGGDTLVSLSWSGDVLTYVSSITNATWSGVGGTFTNYYNGSGQGVSLTGFGSFKDLTTGNVGTINSVQFINNSGTMMLDFFSPRTFWSALGIRSSISRRPTRKRFRFLSRHSIREPISGTFPGHSITPPF